jgi:hypothetical protein
VEIMTLQDHVIAHLSHVEGVLNYLKPTTEKPCTYAFAPPSSDPRADPAYEAHSVRIHDLRPVASQLSLDR